MEFKLAIGDPKSKRTYKAVLSGADAEKLVGKKIGEKFRGEILNLAGCELQITGGSDKDGFPIRPDVHGGVRRKIILSGGIGFNPKDSGQRKRKTVRGNVITEDIVQINMKIVQENKTDKTKRK